MKARIIDGLIGEKLRKELSDYLDSLEKDGKSIKHVTQSESQHGTAGNHHVTITIWYE